MSVWRRFEGHGFPSLVTTNIADRRPVFGRHAAARAALDAILGAQQQLKFDLIAWVIMPDHIHLVVQLSEGVRLARVMQLIKGRFARR